MLRKLFGIENSSAMGGVSLDEVRKAELVYIEKRRDLLDPKFTNSRMPTAESLVGLALSGGGIRSATTNLGVLQALSRMGILPWIDYLCTVSGGGYIGGCLSGLLSINNNPSREPGRASQHEIADPSEVLFKTEWERFPFHDKPGNWPDSGRAEIKQLRTHGNFLLTRKGFFTTETLQSVGGILTGIAYHWLLFFLAFASIAAICLFVTLQFLAPNSDQRLRENTPASSNPSPPEAKLALLEPAAPIPGNVSPPATCPADVTDCPPTTWQMFKAKIGLLGDAAEDFKKEWKSSNKFQAAGLWGAGLAPVSFIVVWLAICFGWRWTRTKEGESREDSFHRGLVKRIRWIAALGIAAIVFIFHPGSKASGTETWLFLPLVVAAGFWIGGFGLYVLLPWGEILRWRHFWSRQFRTSWGSVLAIATYWVIGAIGLVIYPFVVYGVWTVGILALIPPLISALASRSLVTRLGSIPAVPTRISARLKNVLLGILVVLFIILSIVTLAAWLIDWGQPNFLVIALASLFLLFFVGWIGNSNKIGLHYFYRDRLMETYLRTEMTNPELTLDLVHDVMDMNLKELHGVLPGTSDEKLKYQTCVSAAPYHLVSAAINIAERRDLTRKDRKSGYFIFSKLYCGSYHTNFRSTVDYQGGEVKLARAITISGAAVGSGMGSQTFFAQAFATTLFNLRLGYWLENPGKPLRVFRKWAERPIFSPWYLLKEMFSWTHARGRLVNLSDGGHTGDNVGIYPLLQRRCKVIIACDAEADPKLAFGSFTEALRHAYVDMNIDVDIDLTMIRPDPVTGLSRSHCAVGRIRYPEEPGGLPAPEEAWLIYLKNNLTGDEPEPIKNYKVAQSDFPHETTVDQFFDDAQFESYRALGDHLVEHTFEPVLAAAEPLSTGALRNLQSYHSTFKAADDPDYRTATQRLSQLENLLTTEQGLRWYYEECYLNQFAGSANDNPLLFSRVVLEQVRLMEYVFITLDLGRHGNAPDNRGWMNLFRSWARSYRFRDEIEKLKGTFTKDFEEFYESYIKDLQPIEIQPIPHPWDANKPKGVFLDPGRREARA